MSEWIKFRKKTPNLDQKIWFRFNCSDKHSIGVYLGLDLDNKPVMRNTSNNVVISYRLLPKSEGYNILNMEWKYFIES